MNNMLKIQVLGKGMIPRGYGLAPRKEPFPADYLTIGTIIKTPGLKVKYLNPESGKLMPLDGHNVKRIWDRYANWNPKNEVNDVAPPEDPKTEEKKDEEKVEDKKDEEPPAVESKEEETSTSIPAEVHSETIPGVEITAGSPATDANDTTTSVIDTSSMEVVPPVISTGTINPGGYNQNNNNNKNHKNHKHR